MLFISGKNLRSGAISFIGCSSTITLFSAYLKKEQLVKLNHEKKINQIVVRWDLPDLCLGVSDLEVYDYCRENNITLYRNTRLHLKAFWDSNGRLFFGSANVTGRGIGEEGNYNYELNGLEENLSFEDKLYLNYLIQRSEYVDDKLFKQLNETIKSVKLPTTEYPKVPTQKKEVDYFLISQLPMTSTPERLFEIYSNRELIASDETNYAIHDLVVFNIKSGLESDSFFSELKESFNNQSFILKFKESIKTEPGSSLRFGTVRKWFTANTTTVPTPRAWSLSESVRILYRWICYFDNQFTWDVPGRHSQVIYYMEANK